VKQVIHSKASLKQLHRLPANTRRLIESRLASYAADPASLANNVKTLKGSTDLRLRIGNWRVIFREDAVAIRVIKIATRGSAYD
jgi:mRNA interferase RelE/StbE